MAEGKIELLHTDRAIAVGAVVLLHLLVFGLFATVRPSLTAPVPREFDVSVFNPSMTPRSPPPPPISWVFAAPDDVVVPEPDITIVSPPGDPDGIIASMAGQVVPPRLDPRHPNMLPDVPYDLRGAAAIAVIMLHLLILPDRSVEDAKVLKSSNNADLDTLDYVKANWRYLPPSMGGKPIEAWTTAFVRFATRTGR